MDSKAGMIYKKSCNGNQSKQIILFKKVQLRNIRQTRSVIAKSVNESQNISGVSRRDKPIHPLEDHKNSD